MEQRTSDKFWFPWWPDKWIFGSVRIECTPAERGIWVDLLSLASKDNGYIRANEDTPYPLKQLAGMLIIPEKELNDAINKFIRNKKLTQFKNGTLYITKWDKYQFSERHKRRIKKTMSAQAATVSEDEAAILNNNKKNNKKLNNKTESLDEEFEYFWKFYKSIGNPKDDIGDKQDAKKAFKTLRKNILVIDIAKAAHGEADYLKYKRLQENFIQRKKFASTWLRSNRWKAHKDFKYEAIL